MVAAGRMVAMDGNLQIERPFQVAKSAPGRSARWRPVGDGQTVATLRMRNFVPCISSLAAYDLDPHVVIQHPGEMVVGFENTLHLLITPVSISSFHLTYIISFQLGGTFVSGNYAPLTNQVETTLDHGRWNFQREGHAGAWI